MAQSLTRRAALVAATLVAAGCATIAATPASLSGTVFYRERIALPPTAEVQVQLLDVSLADAPAVVIAETKIAAGPGTPTAWALTYDPARIDPRHSYALQARILEGETLLFTNTDRYAVFTGGADTTDILVHRVGRDTAPGPSPTTGSPVGAWLAEDIQGGGVIDNLRTTLTIAADGAVSGHGGCNGFGGTATIKGDAISFGQMRSTLMACTPAAMDQEQKFHRALTATRSFRVDPATRKLTLLDQSGKPVAVLAAI